MLGFFAKTKDESEYIKKGELFFVHVPSELSKYDVKLSFTKNAFDYANKLNLKKVYLHFGKEIIEYDF